MNEKCDISSVRNELAKRVPTDHAALQAAIQADELLAASDMDGSAIWRKIIKAIDVLQSTEPGGSTH